MISLEVSTASGAIFALISLAYLVFALICAEEF